MRGWNEGELSGAGQRLGGSGLGRQVKRLPDSPDSRDRLYRRAQTQPHDAVVAVHPTRNVDQQQPIPLEASRAFFWAKAML